jgi:hypothetical protein
MKDRLARVLLTLVTVGVASLILASILTGGSEPDAAQTTLRQECPDGQALVGGEVDGFRFEQPSKRLPTGMYYLDTVAGDGERFEIRSDNYSTTVTKGRPDTFTIQCEDT